MLLTGGVKEVNWVGSEAGRRSPAQKARAGGAPRKNQSLSSKNQPVRRGEAGGRGRINGGVGKNKWVTVAARQSDGQ
jgi:hypothetical protein